MSTFYIVPSPYDAQHHGVLGMKWGVRRYQNKDGTLTPEGRRRLGYENFGSNDSVIKKGTRTTRVVHDPNAYERRVTAEAAKYDPQMLKDFPKLKEFLNENIYDVENNLDTKYVSVDNYRDPNGKVNGEEYYVNWFTDNGWDTEGTFIDDYIFKKDMKVASGQKVIDQIIKEVGNKTIEEYLMDSNKNVYKELSMKYTNDKSLHKAVNDYFLKIGYDAIEDINDINTEMPIVVLNAKSALELKGHKTAEEWIEKYFENQKK